MFARSSAGGGLAVALLAALMSFTAPASAHASISRTAAAKSALKALKVSGDTHAVRVFGTPKTVAARTRITQSAPAGRSTTDRRTGVQSGKPAAVMSVGGEPVWLFYADRGPHQGFQHPGRIALVGVRTGKVTLSRTLAWVPLVGGRLPVFFSSADGYEGNRYVVFDRPWPGAAPATPATPVSGPATEAERRAAAALAAQHACVLRFSDSLGNFFDFGRVDQTRAQLGRFFKRLSDLDAGFVTERYLPKLGRTPAAEAQRLIDQAGCRDLTLYAAGAAASTGPGAVVIGLRAGHGSVQWQTLTTAALRALLRANPNVSFKLVFDAPYTGRLAEVLRHEKNVSVLLASGGANQPTFAYLPALTGPQGTVLNPGNPAHLLEFTNDLIGGLDRFAGTPAEVDHAIAQTSTTFMAWMLARAVNLAGAPFGGHLTDPVEILPDTSAPSGTTLPGSAKPNTRPVGVAAAQVTDEDTPVSFTLGGTDADGDPLTFALASAPAHGTLDGSGPRVTYTPAKDYDGADSLSYRVSDGKDSSDPVAVTIAVDPVNDAPVVAPSAGQASYTEQDAPVAVDPDLALSDVDSATLAGASVAIGSGDDAGLDTLEFTDQSGITGAWDASTGVLTLSGTAPVADYEAALRSVAFTTPGDDPSTAVRTIRFGADDGEPANHAAAVATRELAVVAVNDNPTLATSSTGSAAYTEDGAAATVDPNLTIADPDSSALVSATVSVTTAHEAGDRLDFTAQSSIAGAYDAATGVLTLSGPASLASYQAVLRSVQFHTVSDNPSETARAIAFRADDGAAIDHVSNLLTRGLTVARHNDAPAVTVTTGAATYTEGAAPSAVDAGLTVTDPDSAQFAGATVKIAAANLDPTHDSLGFTAASAAITGAYDAPSGVLTLSGLASVADYQQTLRSVTFANSGDDPSTSRTLTFGAIDSAGSASAAATRALTITPVNDAPALTASPGSASYTENAAPVTIDPALTVADADSAQLTGATVSITVGYSSADRLRFTDQGAISGSYDTGVLTLSGAASPAAYQAALRSVAFETLGDDPSGAARTIAFVADDGASANHLSTAVTRGVTVTPVNDAPTVTTSAGNSTWTEGNPPAAVDAALTVGDGDSTQLASAQAEISAATVQTGDALSFTATASITGTYDATTHILSLAGADTVAGYQAALRSVRFANSTTTPGATTRHILFRVTDTASASSADAARDVAVDEVNSKPVVQTSASGAAFVEDAGPVAVDPALSVTDADSPALASAVVTITANRDAVHDSLTYTAPGGNPVTAGAYNALDGTLTLSGAATPAQYQAALRAVKFANDDDAPSLATRTVRFAVDDGSSVNHASDTGANSDQTVTVTASNDAPTVHTTSGGTAYTERAAAVAIDSGLTISDPDSANLAGATVTIKTGAQTGDALTFATPPAGISGSVDAGGDTVTFTGTASRADYETALRGVKFASTNANPTATRTIAFTASDTGPGNTLSAEATKAIAITAVNNAPVVTTSGGTAAFTEDDAPTAIDGAVTVSDADNASLQGATVAISGGFNAAQDSLAFANTANITESYNAATGVLTLSGGDTLANYQAALRTVRYANANQNPDTATRTIAFSATDGTDSSAPATKTLSVARVNDAPTVTTTAGASSFTEDQAAGTIVDAGVTVADVDNTTLASATVAITSNFNAAQDVLQFTNTATITGALNTAGDTLTLSGADTLANYQAALRSVRYANTSQAPTTATRTHTFSVSDGAASSTNTPRTKDVGVVSVNDAPALSPAGAVTFTENGTATPAAADAVAIAPDLTAADVDSASLTGATVQITGGYKSGEDVLSYTTTNGVAGSVSGDTITLTGSHTLADYQAALRAVTYRDSSNAPDTGTRTIRFVADDGQGVNHASAPLDRTVDVVAVNDAPTATGKSFTGANRAVGNTTLRVHDAANGATPAVTGPSKDVSGDLTTGATDPDGPGPLVVVAASGQATAQGGTVDLLADGDFIYHPKAGFSGSDTFTYTVSDQSTPAAATSAPATVTIDVQDVVWYVNGAAAASGADGRSDHPFPSLSGVNGASDADAAGQTLFLYSGTYTGGLALEGNQQLLSQRNGLAVPDGSGSGTVTLVAPAGANADVDGGVTLASGNTLQGIDLGTTSGYALSGSSVGSATIDTVTSGAIGNPNGGAVSIAGTGNALNVQLTSVNSNGATGNAIAIAGASGSFNAAGGSLANAGAADVSLSGGTLGFTLGATVSDTTGTLVAVSGQTAGLKDFNGALTGGAVSLTGNTGATVRFDGGVNLSTFANDAFTASGGGTVAVTGSANTLDTTTGRALDVAATTISSDGLTFRRISANGATQGIVLDTTGSSGSLAVTGNGATTCTKTDQSGCSGGTIQNGVGTDDSGATPVGTGIVLNDTQAPSFTRMYLHDFSNYAIRGRNVRGFTLANSVVSGINGTTIASPYQEGSAKFTDLSGSASIAQSYVAGGIYDNVRVTNDGGTLDRLTVQNSEIGANGALGNDGLNVESLFGTSSKLNVTVDHSTFTSAAGDLFQATIDGSGGGDLKFAGNTLSNNHPAIASGVGGVTLEGARGGDVTMDVSNNTSTGARGQAILITKGEGFGTTLSGSVTSNTIGVPATANSGSSEGNGIDLEQNGGGALTMSVASNTLSQYNGDGIHLQAGAGVVESGQLNVALTGNKLSNPGSTAGIAAHQGVALNSGVMTGDSFTTCLNIGTGNTITGSGSHGGTDFRLRQRQSTRVKLISPTGGYTGGAFDMPAITSFVQSAFGGAPSGTIGTDTNGAGFVGGTSCP
jgi:hypothetical protein